MMYGQKNIKSKFDVDKGLTEHVGDEICYILISTSRLCCQEVLDTIHVAVATAPVRTQYWWQCV